MLNALAELPVTVIAATAGRSDLKTVPANAFVADYLPGEAAAARSAVVVCNGGSLTTQQALVAGVPVIGVAGNLDQHLNMEAVERAGAGVLLRTERLKSQRVAGAVMQVISRSEYRQAAARLADAFGRDRVGFPQHVENALRLMPENRPRTWLASIFGRLPAGTGCLEIRGRVWRKQASPATRDRTLGRARRPTPHRSLSLAGNGSCL